MVKKTVITLPEIVLVDGPFDAGLAGLQEEGVSLWSVEKLAELRVLLGASHPLSKNWSWVAPNFNYVTDSGADILIASGEHNPLLRDPAAAVREHREGREVYLSDAVARDLRGRAETDPIKARASGVYHLQRKDVKSEIPVEAIGEYGPTVFLFGEQAKPYGEFLQANKIHKVPFVVASEDYTHKTKHEGRVFARALWVNNLGNWSGLGGDYDDLRRGNGRVGGVRPYAREAGALETRLDRE